MPGRPNKFSQFWLELKRRSVIHVIIVYATAAFVILEAVDIIFPRLGFPDWTVTFVMILLAVGFPIALIFSWIFDVTPQGLERTQPIENLRKESDEAKHFISKRNQNLGKTINWSLVGILVFMIGVYMITKSVNNSDTTDIIKFSTILPSNEYLDCYKGGSAVAISPDGSQIVFVAVRNGTSYLMLRRLDHIEVTRMTGTEGASSPFFSRNGEWIGFFADGYLKKVPILGGAPITICETRAGYDGCWMDENTIIFADAFKRCLMRVPSSGGIPNQITSTLKFIEGDTEQSHCRPQVLPGGKEFIYTIINNSDDVRIAAYSIETGKKQDLIDQGCNGIYVSSGHLVYTWKGDLMAVPFDLKRMEVTGSPVMIIDGVLMDYNSLAHISISDGGSMVYVPGDFVEYDVKPMMVDTSGEYEILDFPPGGYQSPRFSPDGKQVLICYVQEKANFWIYDLDRGTFRRITNKDYEAYWAIWSPDGQGIAFNSNIGGSSLNLYMKEFEEIDSEERLSQSEYHQQPQCWTNDGKFLIFSQGIQPETGIDIFLLQMDTKEVRPLLNSSANESHPNLSNDGKWLAYCSDQSGREDVFVCSFPDLSNIKQVSRDGGVEPVWSTDSNQLYFRDITGDKLMVVSTHDNNEKSLELSKPMLFMEGNYKASTGPWGRNYDISPDGEKLLFISDVKLESEPKEVNVILNWKQELIELVPATK